MQSWTVLCYKVALTGPGANTLTHIAAYICVSMVIASARLNA